MVNKAPFVETPSAARLVPDLWSSMRGVHSSCLHADGVSWLAVLDYHWLCVHLELSTYLGTCLLNSVFFSPPADLQSLSLVFIDTLFHSIVSRPTFITAFRP